MFESLSGLYSSYILTVNREQSGTADSLWFIQLTDILLALIFLVLSGVLFFIFKRRNDHGFRRLFLLFGVMCLLNGIAHALAAVTPWWPALADMGILHFSIAIIALVSLIAVIQRLPDFLKLPTIAQIDGLSSALSDAEQKLQHKVKVSTDKLLNSQAKLDLVVGSSAIGLWSLALATKEFTLDKNARAVFDRVSAAENVNFSELLEEFSPIDRESIECILMSVQDIGECFDIQVNLSKNHGNKHVLLRGKLIKLASTGQLIIQGVVVDMSLSAEAKQALNQLDSIIEMADDAIIVINRSGHITVMNNAAEQLFGMPANSAVGQSLIDVIPVLGVCRFNAIVQDLHANNRTDDFELVFDEPSGIYHNLHIHISRIQSQQGKACNGATISIKDVSALREQESQMRIIFEATPNGLLMIDKSGVINEVNKPLAKMLGYKKDEMLGQPLEMILPENMREMQPGLRERFFNEPIKRTMTVGSELVAMHKNGSKIPIEIGLSPVKTADGWFALASVTDITERNIQQNKLRLNEERYRRLSESTTNMVWSAAPNGYFIEPQPEFAEYTGIKWPDYNNDKWAIAIIEKHRKKVMIEWQYACDNEAESFHVDTQLWCDATKSYHYVEIHAVPIQISGQIVEWVGSVTDVNEKTQSNVKLNALAEDLGVANVALKKQKKLIEQATHAKSMFLANMSHEIRTPMNAVLGFAQIMQRDETLAIKHKKSLQVIQSAGNHLLSLINDVLDLAKIEADSVELKCTPFNLMNLLDDLSAMFENRCAEKNLVWRLETNLPPN